MSSPGRGSAASTACPAAPCVPARAARARRGLRAGHGRRGCARRGVPARLALGAVAGVAVLGALSGVAVVAPVLPGGAASVCPGACAGGVSVSPDESVGLAAFGAAGGATVADGGFAGVGRGVRLLVSDRVGAEWAPRIHPALRQHRSGPAGPRRRFLGCARLGQPHLGRRRAIQRVRVIHHDRLHEEHVVTSSVRMVLLPKLAPELQVGYGLLSADAFRAVVGAPGGREARRAAARPWHPHRRAGEAPIVAEVVTATARTGSGCGRRPANGVPWIWFVAGAVPAGDAGRGRGARRVRRHRRARAGRGRASRPAHHRAGDGRGAGAGDGSVRGRQRCGAGGAARGGAGRADVDAGAADGRDRHGQGGRGPPAARMVVAARAPVHPDQLRRDPERADRSRAVRLREGRVHRFGARVRGPADGGRGRDGVSRRGRRHAAAVPGEAAARAGGPGGQPHRRERVARRRLPDPGRHQPRSPSALRRRPRSAPTFTSAWRSCRSGCRRCASASPICRRW